MEQSARLQTASEEVYLDAVLLGQLLLEQTQPPAFLTVPPCTSAGQQAPARKSKSASDGSTGPQSRVSHPGLLLPLGSDPLPLKRDKRELGSERQRSASGSASDSDTPSTRSDPGQVDHQPASALTAMVRALALLAPSAAMHAVWTHGPVSALSCLSSTHSICMVICAWLAPLITSSKPQPDVSAFAMEYLLATAQCVCAHLTWTVPALKTVGPDRGP